MWSYYCLHFIPDGHTHTRTLCDSHYLVFWKDAWQRETAELLMSQEKVTMSARQIGGGHKHFSHAKTFIHSSLFNVIKSCSVKYLGHSIISKSFNWVQKNNVFFASFFMLCNCVNIQMIHFYFYDFKEEGGVLWGYVALAPSYHLTLYKHGCWFCPQI